MTVFLGNFMYAEFIRSKHGNLVKLTDTDGCGRVLDTIQLNAEQVMQVIKGWGEADHVKIGGTD
jgi:hypothetical protein